MGNSLLIELLGSLLWFLIGYGCYYIIRTFGVIKPIKKLWNINDPKNLIICAATSTRTDTGHYLRPATGIGQVRALGYSIESLSKAYDIKIQNILLSDDQVQRQIDKDLIILGGPKNNLLAKIFLDKVGEIEMVANQEMNIINWHIKSKEFRCEGKRINKKVVKDYGLIIRAENPFCSSEKHKTSVTLFTGCHTYGTIAAAKFFTDKYINEFKGFKSVKKNIYLLVECDVIDGYPQDIKLIREYEN